MARTPGVWTIGHSTLAPERFLELLDQNAIGVVADVRSQPYSRFSPHFSREELEATLLKAGVNYVFLGRELGGRPHGADYYDAEGHALYWRMAESEPFAQGLERLLVWARRYRVAMLCSEEDPSVCHRRLLVSRVLHERGVEVRHVRADGRVETEAALRAGESRHRQASLLDPHEDPTWRSPQSVSHKSPQRTSSSG